MVHGWNFLILKAFNFPIPDIRGCPMPRYYFSLGNCLPPPQAIEELPDDKAARALAITVAEEMARNRHGRSQECVIALNERGQLIYKAWTSSDLG